MHKNKTPHSVFDVVDRPDNQMKISAEWHEARTDCEELGRQISLHFLLKGQRPEVLLPSVIYTVNNIYLTRFLKFEVIKRINFQYFRQYERVSSLHIGDFLSWMLIHLSQLLSCLLKKRNFWSQSKKKIVFLDFDIDCNLQHVHSNQQNGQLFRKIEYFYRQFSRNLCTLVLWTNRELSLTFNTAATRTNQKSKFSLNLLSPL